MNTSQGLAFYPYKLLDFSYSDEFNGNFYIFSMLLSSLAMNVYSGTTISDERNRLYKGFNYFCCIAALGSFLLPLKALPYGFILTILISVITYLYGMYCSFKMYNTVSKSYFYALISYILLIVILVPSGIFVVYGVEFFSLRLIAVPIYLCLHTVMLTLKYRDSQKNTSKLADDLAETIEKISHSDNALQCTQMKADFLYETLDTICERCESDPFTAEELTISLSKYLRHTLNFKQLEGIVPLSNELELTKAYIAIEKERYPKISFDLKIPQEVPNVYVPPLSIQPLIENSIEHGIDLEQGGKISLTISPYRDYCQVDVSDNGLGIAEDKIKSLPEFFPQATRIGLYSINKRLVERFGKGLVIQSAPSVGTSVSFVVPPEGKDSLNDGEEGRNE